MTNMYLFLYSAQILLQYYVTKMDVHICIFLEKKYYAWLVSFGGVFIKPTLNSPE